MTAPVLQVGPHGRLYGVDQIIEPRRDVRESCFAFGETLPAYVGPSSDSFLFTQISPIMIGRPTAWELKPSSSLV